MVQRQRQRMNGRHGYVGPCSDPIGHCGPPHLRLAVETLPVRDFDVAVCQVSDFGLIDDEHADFRLVAMTDDHWYQVCRRTDLDGARKIARELERPTARTHRLCLVYDTRSANLTPELYVLTGQTTVMASFMRVHWAPEGSEFEVGAEYGRPLDARHPRRVTAADLDADRRRQVALYPLWAPRVADAYYLIPRSTDGEGTTLNLGMRRRGDDAEVHQGGMKTSGEPKWRSARFSLTLCV